MSKCIIVRPIVTMELQDIDFEAEPILLERLGQEIDAALLTLKSPIVNKLQKYF